MNKHVHIANAYDKGCVGCTLQEKDVMITLATEEEHNTHQWNDWLLTQEQAESLLSDLERVVESNRKKP